MRCGVGAPDELARHGIAVVAALPGVGRNLIEHPSVSVSCYLDRDGAPAPISTAITRRRRCVSPRACAGCPPGDMCIAVLARSGWHALGQRVGSLYFFVNKAYSQGSVTLRSADPRDEPLVDFRMLSDRRDLERLRNAFRFVAEIATAPELDGMRTKIFPTNYSDRVRGVSVPAPAQRDADGRARRDARHAADAARLADRHAGDERRDARRRARRRCDARCLPATRRSPASGIRSEAAAWAATTIRSP